MLPDFRPYSTTKNNYQKSAVALIFWEDNDTLKIILTKRSNNVQKHKNQISLPGGAFDPIKDTNLWDTAKRETFEEIGIKLCNNNLVGELTSIEIPNSKFIVTPFITYLEKKPETIKLSKEVEKIFFPNFFELVDDSNIYSDFIKSDNKNYLYKYYKLEDEKVWGATAMILTEFKFIINSIKNEKISN